MVRIIHSSDFQLGRQFLEVGKSGDLVRKALKESFEATIKLALDRGVDALFVAGNLFATNLISRHLVGWFYQQVERLGKIPCVVLPGTTDPLDENSLYRYLPAEGLPENLHILGMSEGPIFRCEDSSVTFYRMPSVHPSSDFSGRQEKLGYEGVHVVALNLKETPKDEQESKAVTGLVESVLREGFDYVAVGGMGTYHQFTPKSYSCAPAEANSFHSTTPGEVMVVEFADHNVKIEKVTTGKLRWKYLELDNSQYRYTIELEEEISKHASPDTLLKIKLDGAYVSDGFLDTVLLERSFRDKFCFLQIDDCRRFGSENPLSLRSGAGSLMNDYNKLLQEAIQKAPPELKLKYMRAMYTGSAMLAGKDVIG